MGIKMVAKERIRYPFLGPEAREYDPGQEFELNESNETLERNHAEMLELAGKATIVKVASAPVAAPAPQPVEPPAPELAPPADPPVVSESVGSSKGRSSRRRNDE